MAADIAAVQNRIDNVSEEIRTCSSKKEKYQLREKEHQLREEKQQLREKEHQLREKERLLLQLQISNGKQKNKFDGVDIYRDGVDTCS